MNKLWTEFLRYSARRARGGAVRSFDGLEAAWVHSALPFFNATYLTSAPVDPDDLERRLAAAQADAAPHGLPWMLFTYDRDFAACPIPAGAGFDRAMSVRVMTGDVARLREPQRPLPAVVLQRVTDDASARDAYRLNTLAYGLPAEMAESLAAAGPCYGDAARDFGYVAYVEGVAVSTASVMLLDKSWLYVALVATAPEHQKRGYAEAVMRHALREAAAATGVSQTSLDATDAGAPVYARMGYAETGETWGVWMPRR